MVDDGTALAARDYGIHHVGLLAPVQPATVQQLSGGCGGGTAADRAHDALAVPRKRRARWR
ncbi:hypothetical protein DN051_43765 (plasmid) [Streptomyces cadmiisoli]|uniref:Uncharacterized protein n=1 Tax=Streptomyces cadmiisoli TaxID=2184053 RepID=A0A2Z4JEQ3_9ACTN|nr:hypothetical protein DN051_43765 [Streptomyces cadmiisoli]